jgi:hypothetical protein
MPIFILIGCAGPVETTSLKPEPDASMAAYHTDQYVWEKMVRSFQVKTTDPMNLDWELWSTTEHAYSNPCGGVSWPTKGLDWDAMPPKLVTLLDDLDNRPGNFNVTDFAKLTLNATNPYYEELRINQPMFEYIQQNALYNQDTVYKLAKEHKISFPKEAMMIKAQWIPIDSSRIDSFYSKKIRILVRNLKTNDSTLVDTLMGLVGFHLVTHELPNWVWSTFEFAGNVGMCDYIGCKDNFGCNQAFIPPNKLINRGYPNTQPSEKLAELMTEYGLPEVFKYYRLKGSQTEYTSNEGDTLILGNSILEMNLVPTSSCISCHARATLNNSSTRQNLSMFLPEAWPFDTFTTPFHTKGFHPLAYTGTPVPQDYINADSNGTIHPDSVYYRTDFMWQLAQHSKKCSN